MSDDRVASDLPRAARHIERGLTDGLHIGAVLAVRHGDRVYEGAWGEARRGVAATPRTLCLWLSSGKPVGAVCLARLWERGLLQLDDPVARFVPEFAQAGKQAVTLRHILTHTGGFRQPLPAPVAQPWHEIVQAVCRLPLEPGWVPGNKAGYHATSSWIILGEVVRRIDGRPFERFARDEVFDPAGMADAHFAMSIEAYDGYGPRMGVLHETPPRADGPRQASPVAWDTRENAPLCRPGSSFRATAADLVAFYRTLLADLAGARTLLLAQTVEALVAPHRVGLLDHTFKHVMDWGLGIMVNSARHGVSTVPYRFGPHASARTFGHAGAQSSTAFADPENRLIVAVHLNGMCGEKDHQPRMADLLTSVYEDLGLGR